MRLHRGCPVGILRPKASTDFNNVRTLWATLRHDMLFQALSPLRVHPIRQTHVHRGVIPEDYPTAFRVAATFHATSASVFHAADKHRATFVIPTTDIQQLSVNTQPRATANLMWRNECLLFVKSAPLSKAGKKAHYPGTSFANHRGRCLGDLALIGQRMLCARGCAPSSSDGDHLQPAELLCTQRVNTSPQWTHLAQRDLR